MSRNRHLMLAKSIIALLFIFSIQILSAQAKAAPLALSVDAQHAVSSIFVCENALDAHKGHLVLISQQSDASENNIYTTSSILIPTHPGMDLEIKETSIFYTQVTIPSTFLQLPELRPPRL